MRGRKREMWRGFDWLGVVLDCAGAVIEALLPW